MEEEGGGGEEDPDWEAVDDFVEGGMTKTVPCAEEMAERMEAEWGSRPKMGSNPPTGSVGRRSCVVPVGMLGTASVGVIARATSLMRRLVRP